MYEVIKIIDGEKWIYGRYKTEERAIEAVQDIMQYCCVPVFIQEVK